MTAGGDPACVFDYERARPGEASPAPPSRRPPGPGRRATSFALQIGRADDPSERDADRAARALDAPARAGARCACGGTIGADGLCDACRARAASAAGPAPTHAPPIVGDVLASGGRPLDAATRSYFEPRLGTDLSGVRVHDDARAAESARAVEASAYSVGRDVVLGDRAPPRDTAAGRRLIGHELAHVAQSRGEPPVLRRQPAATATAFGDAVGRSAWDEAARLLAEMTPGDRRAELTALTAEA